MIIHPDRFKELLEGELGEGSVRTTCVSSFKPREAWSVLDRVRHFLLGTVPMYTLCGAHWTAGDFECSFTVPRDLIKDMDEDTVYLEVICPKAKEMLRRKDRVLDAALTPKEPFPVAEFKYYPGLFPAEKD